MKKHFLTVLLFFAIAPLIAQTAFTATVSKNKVGLNERFQLILTLENGSNVSNLKAPSLAPDFIILGGPSQSNSFSSINGKVSKSVTYLYVLQARNTGKYTVGIASVKVGGETYSTQPVSIEVIDSPVSDTQNNSGKSSVQTTDVSSNIFIKTEISDAEIYKGEQVTVIHKLYIKRNGQIMDYALKGATKIPKLDGFYAQDVNLPEAQLLYETMNGEQYAVQIIKKTVCTAQSAGNLAADPLVVDAIVRVKSQKQTRSRDPFDDFFNNNFPDPFSTSYQDMSLSLASNTAKIKVNELPANAPSDFNGAVGKFSMSTELTATKTNTDEPLTYRIVINGDGNLSLFEAPQLNLPPGWETYEPKISEGKNSRSYEYLLIPRSPGKFNIPSHTWSYFSPFQKRYITLTSESYDVNVDAGANYNLSANTQGINKEDVELLAKDIRYINKDAPEYKKENNDITGSPLFYGALGLPFILGIGVFILTSRRKELAGDVVALKNKRATAYARKRLSKANEYIKKNEGKAFYNEVIRAIWGYLSDKFNIPQSELSKENIQSYLVNHQVSETSSQEVLQLLNTCEMALFAPLLISGSLVETYRHAIELITKMENEIKQ